MEGDTIVSLISNLGFPIAMCMLLFWYMIKEKDAHKEEMEQLRQTLADNTRILTELSTLIKTISNYGSNKE